MSEDATRVGALLALYRASHYDVELADGRVVTIRIGQPPPDAIVEWIGADGVANFLTACNPRSMALTADENGARLALLRAELDVRGMAYLEGAGHLPGEIWREASVLVRGIDGDDVATIAARYEQNAVVVVRRDSVPILRVYREDWRAAVGDVANLEWS